MEKPDLVHVGVGEEGETDDIREVEQRVGHLRVLQKGVDGRGA